MASRRMILVRRRDEESPSSCVMMKAGSAGIVKETEEALRAVAIRVSRRLRKAAA